MMLLDTCVVSEVAKRRPDPRVLAWFEAIPESDLHLSVLTIGEISKGCAKLHDGERRRHLEAWLAGLRIEFSERVYAIDEETAEIWGRLSGEAEKVGSPVPTIDGLIAATAIRRGMTVVTRNEAHFVSAGARVFNPWKKVTLLL